MICYHAAEASQHQNTVTVSRGAYAFVAIMRPYMCATGPRAGSTKFSDTDKRAIINRHLEQDGKLPISRSTYYRWKRDAKRAGLLDFSSTAKRPGDRHRVRGGGWMRVAPAHEVQVWGQGRRPRNNPLLARETFSTPPANETFSTPPNKEDLRDLSPLERSIGEGAAARQKPVAPPSPSPKKIPREAKRLAAKLTDLARILDPEWEADLGRIAMRERATAKALRAMQLFGGDRAELEVILVGLMKRRHRELEDARAEGCPHRFWDLRRGDPVARAAAYLADAGSADYPIAEDLWELGATELWRGWRIDANTLDPDRGLTIKAAA